MKPFPSSERDEHDRKLIKILKDLESSESNYPPELLSHRRAAFLAQVEERSPGDRETVKLLGNLKSAQQEYPPDLLAARRAAFLSQIQRTGGGISLLEQFRDSIQRIFQKRMTPAVPSPGSMRTSLVIASLIAAVMIGALFFARVEQSSPPSLSQAAAAPTRLLPTGTVGVALTICEPEDERPSCPPGELDPSRDLADPRNGPARPAVSKDARASQDGVHQAAYVNDGRGGASWVSSSAYSWIKIDLGKVTNINTVSLQKGSVGSSNEEDPGQFVIAVAVSDVYADGDSSNDHLEYVQVFHSEQAGFSGRASHTEIIKTRFSPVKARFVKITFENASAAIQKVGVFMIEPPVLAEEPTSTSQDDPRAITVTPTHTDTPPPVDSATPPATGTGLPAGTAVSIPTNTATPPETPALLPTQTQLPTDTSTPLPTSPFPTGVPPTAIPPTPIPPTATPTPGSSDPIIVTGNGQTLTFTCNGNDAEIRGHTNTVNLLGACRSITVTGNGNSVFWHFGSPILMDRGKNNIIRQR